MNFDIAQFRLDYPEFKSTAMYTAGTIGIAAKIAAARVSASRWGDLYVEGMSLYVAHALTIAARNVRAAAGGGFPGQPLGVQTSKSLGGASVSYAAALAAATNSPLNSTNYGQSFLDLSSLFGAGVKHIA